MTEMVPRRLPGEWLRLSDAIKEVQSRTFSTEDNAAARIQGGAEEGALFTKGRFYHEEGQAFLISPHAWMGMFSDFACGRLIPPHVENRRMVLGDNWVSVVPKVVGPHMSRPFLHTPLICDVCIHWGSLSAWMEGKPKPERSGPEGQGRGMGCCCEQQRSRNGGASAGAEHQFQQVRENGYELEE